MGLDLSKRYIKACSDSNNVLVFFRGLDDILDQTDDYFDAEPSQDEHEHAGEEVMHKHTSGQGD